jgi:hypothetical protein
VLASRLVRRLVAAAVLAVPAATLTVAATAAPAAAGTVNPPALWMKLDGSPTTTETTFAAAHYRVVVLNAWETAAMRRIKAANPAVTVLAYKCLSSTRSYSGAVDNGADATYLPTGVGYVEAGAHPEWFATDSATGARVQWGPYPKHWQMAVWNAAYQQRWATNVADEVAREGWDGVMADNALTTLKWYSHAALAGAPNDTAIRSGIRSLISTAANALHAKGKVLVPNIGESRLYTGLWSDWTGLADGGQEESFAHMDEDPSTGFVGDWGPDGYAAQAAEMGAPGLNLAITRYLPGDTRSYRYGLASFYVSGGGRGAFTASSDYGSQPLQTEQTWDLGSPVTGVTRVGPAYTRLFSGGFAATNPSETSSVTVPAPAGATDAAGKAVSSVSLAPHTGIVLKLASVVQKAWRHHTAPVAGTTSGTTAATSGTTAAPATRTASPARAARPAARVPAMVPGGRDRAADTIPAAAVPAALSAAAPRAGSRAAARPGVRAAPRTSLTTPATFAGLPPVTPRRAPAGAEALLVLPLLAAVPAVRRR